MTMESGGVPCRLQPPFTFERVASFVAVFFLSIIIFSQYSNLGLNFNTIDLHDKSVGESTNTKLRVVVSLATNFPDCSQLAVLKSTIERSKSSIWSTWNVSSFPNFLQMMHIPTESWNIQKAVFVKMLMRENTKDQFVVGFSGSSVTAGHDNYIHEAYPNVFYEAMLPAMSMLLDGTLNSSRFVVRNHALGNNPCYAYDACIETHLGGDLDILTWEQSMNCGHDPKYVDTFARSSYSMTKKPVLWFLQSGTPFWTPEDCVKNNLSDSLAPKNNLTPEEQRLLSAPLRESAAASGHLHHMDYLRDTPEEKEAALVKRFADLAPMGQNVFGCEAYKCRGPYTPLFSAKTVGGGANWHPGRLGHKLRGQNLAYFLLAILEEAVQDVSGLLCPAGQKSFAVSPSSINSVNHISDLKKSTSGSGVNASSISVGCNMTSTDTSRPKGAAVSAAASAGSNVDAGLHLKFIRPRDTLGAYDLNKQSGKDLDAIVTSVGSTLRLGELSRDTTTSVIADIKHALLRLYLRQGNTSDLSSGNAAASASERQRIVATALREFSRHYLSRPSPLTGLPSSYGVDETAVVSGSRHQCLTDYLPRMSNSLSERLVESNWTLDLSFFDKAAVLKNENKHFGYLDRKMVHTSSGPGSRIAIRIHNVAPNPVWLCELQKGFGKYPAATMGDLNKEADVYVVDNYTPGSPVPPPSEYSKLQKIELVDFSDQCYRSTSKISEGDHLLIIAQKGSLQINLAYVVSW